MEEDISRQIKESIKTLQAQIKNCQQEIVDLQAQCQHPKEEMSLIEERGTKHLRMVCSICKKHLRYPGKDDLEKNDYHQ